MAGEGYKQENQSSQEVKRHEREARYKQARVRLPMDEYENFIIDEEAAPVVKQIYSLCFQQDKHRGRINDSPLSPT